MSSPARSSPSSVASPAREFSQRSGASCNVTDGKRVSLDTLATVAKLPVKLVLRDEVLRTATASVLFNDEIVLDKDLSIATFAVVVKQLMKLVLRDELPRTAAAGLKFPAMINYISSQSQVSYF